MKKTLICLSVLVAISAPVFANQNESFHLANGQQTCQEKYPGIQSCYPIHGDISLKTNEALVLKFSDLPFDFPLLRNQTGFVTANNNTPINDKLTVWYGVIKHNIIYPLHIIYSGTLGINKVGLDCGKLGCFNWS